MKISVKTLTAIPLDVESSHTVGDVKAKIQETQGIPSDQQRLVFTGEQLDDDDIKLADYNIGMGSILYLVLPLCSGKRIYIKTLTKNIIGLDDVESSDTVYDVKLRIEKQKRIPHKQQCLIYGRRQLEDGRTLADYNVVRGSDLLLVRRGSRREIQIFVRTLNGESVLLKVDRSDMIREIKEKIEFEYKLPLDNQRLIYEGKQLEDYRTVAYYHIQNESTLHLSFRIRRGMKIIIRTLTGKNFRLENVESSDTIYDVKLQLEKQEGIPLRRQSIKFLMKVLEEGKTLSDYDVDNNSVLLLRLKETRGDENDEMQIFVRTFDGKNIIVKVNCSHMIYEIKEKILSKYKLPWDKLRLILEGKQLEDWHSVAYYNIQKESTIHLHIRVKCTCVGTARIHCGIVKFYSF